MGQKTHPTGNRLGFIKGWDSNWYGGKSYVDKIVEDDKIRKYLRARLVKASVSRVVIERTMKLVTVTIHTARPGVIIGKKGSEIEVLRKELQKLSKDEVLLNIVEVRKPDADAQLIAENVAGQLERRVSYRRAMKRAVQNALSNNAEGIRICLSGRLSGAEIARTEWYIEGKLPLHTLRADIDYGFAEANTTYGIIGVKVWINNGEKHEIDRVQEATH